MAADVFGPMLPAAVTYAQMLAGPGVERGLIGPAEVGRIWDRHLLNCAVVAELVPEECVLADLGSGAGLPGIVLAMVRQRVRVVLTEPMERRTAFLAECVRDLGLGNVEVRRGRAEDLSGQIGADVVTARAVAALDRLAGLAAGLARPGGVVLAIKGVTAAEELERARPALARLGAHGAEIVMAGSGRVAVPTIVVRFRTSSAGLADRSRGTRRGTRHGVAGEGRRRVGEA